MPLPHGCSPIVAGCHGCATMTNGDKIEPTSPFYLGSRDQPGNFITHVILKGDNYLAWIRSITLSLKARRKFLFMDGTLKKPIEKKKMIDWETVNSMLVSWMLISMDPKHAASIPYHHDEARSLCRIGCTLSLVFV